METQKELNILLVEDDDGQALLIEETLKKHLVIKKIYRQKDGEEAVFFVRQQAPVPDLILLDIKIPKIDGHGVLQNLKNDKRFRSIPVIIISSTSDQREINYCYQMGITGYITKPVSYEELGLKIKGLGAFLNVCTLPEGHL